MRLQLILAHATRIWHPYEMDAYFDLGPHSFATSTTNPDAQLWFDRGLNWCYAFNHEEGLVCFQNAAECDPTLAIAHWGIAYAAGPFYNMPWCDFSMEEAVTCTALCHQAITTAQSLQATASPIEAALITALAQRFQAPHPVLQAEFDRWDQDYANAMRSVYADYPHHPDVIALFAEAMMCRTPWHLWDIHTATPNPKADTEEILQVLDRGVTLHPKHPALLHLHIHAHEMAPKPSVALPSAYALEDTCPDGGHLHHMPGHIYMLVGDYARAMNVSQKAIEADRKYLAYKGPHNFYTTARCHDLHLMMYAAMFAGQYEPAMAAAKELEATLPFDVLKVEGKPYLHMTMESYYSMIPHVLVRFGKWDAIIALTPPICEATYAVSTAMHHYAKGVAYATRKEFDQAEQHQGLFRQAVAKIPEGRKTFNNPSQTVMGVAEEMLAGELAYHQGDYETAFTHLREAVTRCDQLHYSEPWPWMHPPRHALGALLCEQGRLEEAEDVFRTDLGLNDKIPRCIQHPKNIWALLGLEACGVKDADILAALAEAKKTADPSLTHACLCAGHTCCA